MKKYIVPIFFLLSTQSLLTAERHQRWPSLRRRRGQAIERPVPYHRVHSKHGEWIYGVQHSDGLTEEKSKYVITNTIKGKKEEQLCIRAITRLLKQRKCPKSSAIHLQGNHHKLEIMAFTEDSPFRLTFNLGRVDGHHIKTCKKLANRSCATLPTDEDKILMFYGETPVYSHLSGLSMQRLARAALLASLAARPFVLGANVTRIDLTDSRNEQQVKATVSTDKNEYVYKVNVSDLELKPVLISSFEIHEPDMLSTSPSDTSISSSLPAYSMKP